MLHLRILGIVLMVLASVTTVTFAQVPGLKGIINGPIASADQIVIAIDNSGSVKAADRLPFEKTLAKDILDFLGGNPHITVLTFNSTVTEVASADLSGLAK